MIPVILSGGSGTRLWPLSRSLHPKQFHSLLTSRSMIQETAIRLQHAGVGDSPFVLCNEEHRFMVASQLGEIGISPSSIVLEPVARGTAPAVAVAALLIARRISPEAVMGLFPADHLIEDHHLFAEAMRHANKLAEEGHLVTFGVPPRSAHTGYGYLQTKGKISPEGTLIEQFVEKPSHEIAKKYLSEGGYFWNSGMFVFRADVILNAFQSYAPQILNACEAATRYTSEDGLFMRLGREDFENSSSDSIDYAVMEKAEGVMMVPLDAGWDDIGSWEAYWGASQKDEAQNALHGDVISKDTKNSLIISDRGLVATLGIDGLVIVNTPDAVLVAQRDRAEDVKSLVEKITLKDRSEILTHRRVYRPWGSYDAIDQGPGFQVKRIFVGPGKKLSLQRHKHRSEHWVVVKGEAEVTVGDVVSRLTANQSTYIAAGVVHRLANPGLEALEIIEVQTGSYLGEDDIERLEDDFNRVDPG